ncbi:MAG: hypothetical protein ACREP6_00770 [Candidatus Binataceae bacterium]
MIVDWIYNNPTWLWGTILVAFFTGAACIGLCIFHRLVHVEVRRAHNDLAGFIVAIIAVTYAVLLAFIAIATWESFSHAEGIVDSEADYVGNIYRDTQGLPPSMGLSVRTDLQQYVRIVIDKEWPVQELGKVPRQGWKPLHHLHSAIVTMQPKTLGEAVIQAELLRTLNKLYSVRSSRLSAVEGHIPPVIWWIIFLGGAITTGFTYLFGFENFRMHLVMTAAVAASLALVVVLIVALDWPLRGEVAVSPEAFINSQRSWADLPFENPAKSRLKQESDGTPPPIQLGRPAAR